MTTQKTKKNEKNYCCEICDFVSCKKTDYDRHMSTQKHYRNTLTTNYNEKNEKKYICDCCEKKYVDRAGLWRHKKTCNTNKNNEIENTNSTDDNLIKILINQCKDLRDENKELIEILKNGTHNNISNVNSHNKTFNLQLFLNETCKDAMNIMDFVDSIKIQLSDLEKVGKNGFVEGISNIITSNLKALDVTQRPIHCTDNKREVFYIKDENKWEKEADEKDKIRKVIKNVASKNIKMLPKFKEIHPDCIKSDSKFSDQYNKLVVESFGGSGDNDAEKEDKIIKRISSVTTVCKDNL